MELGKRGKACKAIRRKKLLPLIRNIHCQLGCQNNDPEFCRLTVRFEICGVKYALPPVGPLNHPSEGLSHPKRWTQYEISLFAHLENYPKRKGSNKLMDYSEIDGSPKSVNSFQSSLSFPKPGKQKWWSCYGRMPEKQSLISLLNIKYFSDIVSLPPSFQVLSATQCHRSPYWLRTQ